MFAGEMLTGFHPIQDRRKRGPGRPKLGAAETETGSGGNEDLGGGNENLGDANEDLGGNEELSGEARSWKPDESAGHLRLPGVGGVRPLGTRLQNWPVRLSPRR